MSLIREISDWERKSFFNDEKIDLHKVDLCTQKIKKKLRYIQHY